MTVVIPTAVFYVLGVYAIIGMVLYVPLVHWQSKFISPRRTGLAVWRDMRLKRVLVGFFIAAPLAWPAVIWDCIHHEHRRLTRR